MEYLHQIEILSCVRVERGAGVLKHNSFIGAEKKKVFYPTICKACLGVGHLPIAVVSRKAAFQSKLFQGRSKKMGGNRGSNGFLESEIKMF